MNDSLNPLLTAKVRVYTKIPAGVPWFRADIDGSATLVEIYHCLPIGPEDPSRPHQAHLAHIRSQHPGCDLVYVD